MLAYVFPGQGSQSRGMGEGLFERYPDLTSKADEVLGYSIRELCLEDPRRELNKTQFTQPALFVVNALSYLSKREDTGKTPDFVAGHSLGEFNALLASGCFDFETGLKLVKKRGELMSDAPKGGMAAILNSSKDDIEKTLKENNLINIDIANYNTGSQIVISGPIADIGKAQSFFQGGKVMYYPLNTSGAFHSRYMEPVREKFKAYLNSFTFSGLEIPVISNVTALPYSAEQVVENLSNQISSCVLWSDSVRYLIEESRRSGESILIEEVGHGDVLTKIVSRIMDEVGYSRPQDDVQKMMSKVNGENKTENIIIKETSDVGEKVKLWNSRHPVGTKVKSLIMDGDDLETRTEAMVLFGHRAVVYMKGYNGYFDLNEIDAL